MLDFRKRREIGSRYLNVVALDIYFVLLDFKSFLNEKLILFVFKTD